MIAQPLQSRRGSTRKAIAWAILVLILAAACFDVVATPGDGKLGEQARRAIGQWSATQQVDEDWEWTNILVFLVQIALSAQGFDPGKPDGLMGPNTMMALLAWRGEKGEPVAVGLNPSLGIADIVAQLLQVTLETMGLSPGPRDLILGRGESTAALEHWGETFTWGALSMDIGAPEVARQMVTEAFSQAPSSDAEETRKNELSDAREVKQNQSRDAGEGQDRSAGDNSDKDAGHCLKFVWEERSLASWKELRAQVEVQVFRVINTCDFRIWFAWKDNGLAFDPEEACDEGWLIRPFVSSCSLADDQQCGPIGTILGTQTEDQSGPHYSWDEMGRIFLFKGVIVRVNYCAQVYEEELKGQYDWFRPPDCVYQMPRPCGDDSD